MVWLTVKSSIMHFHFHNVLDHWFITYFIISRIDFCLLLRWYLVHIPRHLLVLFIIISIWSSISWFRSWLFLLLFWYPFTVILALKSPNNSILWETLIILWISSLRVIFVLYYHTPLWLLLGAHDLPESTLFQCWCGFVDHHSFIVDILLYHEANAATSVLKPLYTTRSLSGVFLWMPL